MTKHLFSLTLFLFVVIISQATTYYSNPAGGNFNGTIWATDAAGPFTIAGTSIITTDDVVVQSGIVSFNLSNGSTYCTNMIVKSGATVATILQASFAGNVTVESGGVILLGPSGSNTGSLFVQNLFINTGGKVWGNDPVNSGALNVKTIRINGSELVCNGTIGDGANNDALLLQIEGVSVTISGTGNIDVCRIRKGAATNPVTTLIVDANITARFGTTCIYNNQNTSTFNITVNAGKTLKCLGIANPTGFSGTEGSISLNGTTGGSNRRQGLYTINGTLECDNMYLAATSTTATDVFKYLVTNTGILQVNTQLKGNSATASTATTAALEIQAGGTLKLLGALPTATIDGTGAKNLFTFDAASTVVYAGAAQTIETRFGNYGNLIINNNNGIATDNNITINNTLTLTNGIVTANNNSHIKLTNTNVNALTGGSNTAFVNGKLVRAVTVGGNYSFPIGKGIKYANVSLNNITTNTDIGAEYFNTAFANTNTTLPFRVSTGEYWTIEGTNNNIAASIILNYYNGTASGITAPAQLVLAYYNGSQWNNLGQTANTGNEMAGSVTGAATALGVFTFGTTSSLNPLPVTLISFAAKAINTNTVQLNWASAQEINLKNFIVERGIDGKNFYAIGTVSSSNNVLGAAYQFVDVAALNGVVYYRLKCIDVDGSFQYSNTLVVTNNSYAAPVLLQQLNSKARIVFTKEAAYMANVLSMNGQLLIQQIGKAKSAEVNYNHLSSGTYVLQLTYNNITSSFILIK
jgi:hypothetical protein